MFQLLLIAVRNLAQHRRRTLIMGGAIAMVTMLLVVLLGLANGIHQTMLESATTLMTGHVNVGGFFKVSAGQSAPVVTHYPKILELVRKEVPELDYAVHRGRGWAKLVSDTGSTQSGIGGVDIQKEPGLRRVLELTSGNLDDLAKPNTLLIFEGQAKRLGVKVGDSVTIAASTPRGTNNTLDVRVIGIAKDVGLLSKFNVFVPDDSLRALYQLNADTTGAILLYLKNMKDIDAVQARLRTKLAQAGYAVLENDPKVFFMKFESINRESWTGQRLDVTNWEDETSFIKWTITILQVASSALIFVLLILISFGLMNTLWIAIRERTREIGTLRAVGMQRTRVMAMFLVEALVLAMGATVMGSILGVITCFAVNLGHFAVPNAVQLFLMSSRLHLIVDPRAIVGSIVLITSCMMVISLIPSFLAARQKPITAMHHVG